MIVSSKPAKSVAQVAKLKREELDQSLQSLDKGLSLAKLSIPDYEDIISSSATQIVKGIVKSKKWTAEQVVMAFCNRALEVHKATNCCTAFMFDDALRKARNMDLKFKETGSAQGRLHGVPISAKDQIDIEGVDSITGYSKYAFDPKPTSADVIKIMEKEGAIIICKTNVCQTLWSFECENPVFGRTLHPQNEKFTPGGSSGGESALVSAKGSCIGIGSDGGGSLRIPSHFTGLYTLKPTSGVVPIDHQTTGDGGQNFIKSVLGPMAKSIEDLELFFEAISDAQSWKTNATTVPYVYTSQPFDRTKKLKVGYYTYDGVCQATPACRRAVKEAVDVLKKAGHDVVEFKPPRALELSVSFLKALTADGGKNILATVGNDSIVSCMKSSLYLLKTPRIVKTTVSWILSLLSQQKTGLLMESFSEMSVQELWKTQLNCMAYKQEFLDKMNEMELDCILAPVNSHPAITHDTFGDVSMGASYTFIYNLLDYAVGVVPVTKVDRNRDQIPDSEWPSGTRGYRWLLEALRTGKDLVSALVLSHYDVEKLHGMPVGVQIVGKPYTEAKVISILKELNDLITVDK